MCWLRVYAWLRVKINTKGTGVRSVLSWRFAPSFSACDLPVDAGPTKMKYRLNGILCCLCDIKLPVLTTNAVEVRMQGTR